MNQKHKEALLKIREICDEYELEISTHDGEVVFDFCNFKNLEVYFYGVFNKFSKVEDEQGA